MALVLAVSRRIRGRPLRAQRAVGERADAAGAQGERRAPGHRRPRPHRHGDREARRGVRHVDRLHLAQRASRSRPTPTSPSAEALAAEVDFLVVITPGGAGTRKLIDAKVLAALGKKGYLVNVARGSVVDEQALVEALQQRHDRRRRPRRVRERAERAERAARARQRRPHAARRQRDLADAPGDGRPRVRQPRGALRGQAAALAGADDARTRRLRSVAARPRSSPAPARASASRSRAASPRPARASSSTAATSPSSRPRQRRCAATASRSRSAAFDVADPDAVRRRRRAMQVARVDADRHPGQQRRHPAPRADRRVQRRRLAPPDGDQPRRALLPGRAPSSRRCRRGAPARSSTSPR